MYFGADDTYDLKENSRCIKMNEGFPINLYYLAWMNEGGPIEGKMDPFPGFARLESFVDSFQDIKECDCPSAEQLTIGMPLSIFRWIRNLWIVECCFVINDTCIFPCWILLFFSWIDDLFAAFSFAFGLYILQWPNIRTRTTPNSTNRVPIPHSQPLTF